MGFFTKRERSYPSGSILVSDSGIRERIAFTGLTEGDLGVVKAWSEACLQALPAVAEAFYGAVTRTASTRAVLEKHTTVARQRPVMERYLASLFDGRIDDAWVSFRAHVGKRHDEIDLDCMFYFGGYELVREGLARAVAAAGATPAEQRRFGEALGRLLYVDAAITLNALMASRAERTRQVELAARARLERFLDGVSRTVSAVAEGDLTAKVPPTGDEGFDRVGQLFNGALADIGSAIGQVSEASAQIATASHEVTVGSQSSAQVTSEQAGSLEKMSASLEEITGASRLTAQNAHEGQKRAERAVGDATEGLTSMTGLAETIGRIKVSSDQTARIVKTIDEIAFQTNLLALNAAVEAARAGDAGRGFAVVAEEVRNLAIRSAEAAKTTSRMILEAQESADAGVSAEKQVSAKLEAIAGGVRSVRDLIEAISQAASSQTKSVDRIAKSIDSITQSTQHAAAAAEESASAAEELSGQANALREAVGRFRVEGGPAPARGRAGQPPLRARVA